MTRYQLLLLIVLVSWPGVIMGLLFLMGRLENFVNRSDASSPTEAGLEPVSGRADREVRIVFGDQVVGDRVEG